MCFENSVLERPLLHAESQAARRGQATLGTRNYDQTKEFVFGNNEKQGGKGMVCLVNTKLQHFICHGFSTNECC